MPGGIGYQYTLTYLLNEYRAQLPSHLLLWCRSAVRAHQSKFMNLSWLLLAGSLPLSHAELWRVFRGRRRSIPPGSPVGLTNCGNTCYMNSLLQQLFHTPLVQEAFVDSTLPPGRGVLVAELRRAFGRMADGGDGAVFLSLIHI